jgi:murein peptide amidase A
MFPPFPLPDLQARFSSAARTQGLHPHTLAMIGEDPLEIWTRQAPFPDAPSIFLSAGIHGDEPCGPVALCQLLEQLALPSSFHWAVAPLLNPSGLRAYTRHNAQHIDLNRDFLHQRSTEIQALIRWWHRQPDACHFHISLHEDWEASGFYLYEISTCSLPSLARPLLAKLASHFPLQTQGPVDGHELSAPGLIVHRPEPDEVGWPEAIWLARSMPLLSYTLEAPGALPHMLRSAALTLACQELIQLAQLALAIPNPPTPIDTPFF